jgi:alcohol dehydrogenase
VGLLPPAVGRPEVPMELVIAGELAVLGSHGMAAADYPAMLALVTSGAVRLRDLVGTVISLEEAPAALMAMDRAASSVPGITVVDLSR